MRRIQRITGMDIDVLCYGTPTERRLKLRDALVAAGLNVHFAFDVYGHDRDALIARSKVVINPSAFDSGSILDIVRLSFLLANGKAVVMEAGIDPPQEAMFESGVCFAPYEEMVAECIYLCEVDGERELLEARGHALFALMPQAGFLAAAIAELKQD